MFFINLFGEYDQIRSFPAVTAEILNETLHFFVYWYARTKDATLVTVMDQRTKLVIATIFLLNVPFEPLKKSEIFYFLGKLSIKFEQQGHSLQR